MVSTSCLLSKRLERQVTCQPHELLGHRFEPFHQGLGFFELVFSRMIFQFRRHVTGNRGKREQKRTELGSSQGPVRQEDS